MLMGEDGSTGASEGEPMCLPPLLVTSSGLSTVCKGGLREPRGEDITQVWLEVMVDSWFGLLPWAWGRARSWKTGFLVSLVYSDKVQYFLISNSH